MAEPNLEQARAVFDTLCRTMDRLEWHYKKISDLSLECGAKGDDLPMELTIKVDEERSLVRLISLLPFSIPEDKRLDVVVAISALNNALVDGCFDLDLGDGALFYRMTNSYMDSELGEEVFEYLLYSSCQIIDEYNDRFLMLSKGMISLQDWISKINGEGEEEDE